MDFESATLEETKTTSPVITPRLRFRQPAQTSHRRTGFDTPRRNSFRGEAPHRESETLKRDRNDAA